MIIISLEFEKGLTYEAYKSQMSKNRERLEASEQMVEIKGEDIIFFRQLPKPLNVLVITEDWCEPAILALPVLAQLANASHQLRLRFFLRDQNPDLMNGFLKDGLHQTIPAFIFFTPDFKEIGRWYERPIVISNLLKTLQQDLYADPAFQGLTPGTPFAQLPELARYKMIEALTKLRADTQALSNQETVNEIRALIEAGW